MALTAEDDLVFEVIKIRARVAADEKDVRELAEKFVACTIPEGFINWDRVHILIRLHDLVLRQPNEYLKRLMRKTFQEGIK